MKISVIDTYKQIDEYRALNSNLHWHYPRVAGDTPQKGPVWWLPKDELFDDKTRPSDEERAKMIKLIKTQIESLL